MKSDDPETLCEGPGWQARRATRADAARLAQVLLAVPLEGPLRIVVDRRKDFFQAPGLHGGPVEAYIVEDDRGNPVGSGTCAVHDGFVAGRLQRLGYISDLRIAPHLRKARVLPQLAVCALDDIKRRHNVASFHMAIFDGPSAVRRSVLERGSQRTPWLDACPVAPYHLVNLQVTRRRLHSKHTVRPAQHADIPEIAALLAHRQAEKAFAAPINEEILTSRLSTWPGLDIRDFQVVLDRSGRIIGCTALWDPDPVRHLRVTGYSGRLKVQRTAWDLMRPIHGGNRLPNPGRLLRTLFMTHLEVDYDPGVMRALIGAAMDHAHANDMHLVSFLAPKGFPWRRAARGLARANLPLVQCAITPPGHESDEPPPGLGMGIELALA